MSDDQFTPQSPSTSRRALLKGAVGAGVGLAAWGAPKIGSIPAYALTNSSGVYDGVCYYVGFTDGIGSGALSDRWAGNSGFDTPYRSADNASGGRFNRTYTWNGVLPGGANLVVNCNGDPASGGGSTINLVSPPAGCEFESPLPSGTAHSGVSYAPNLPNGPCSPSDAARGGTSLTYSTGTQLLFSGVSNNSGWNIIFFNIVCN